MQARLAFRRSPLFPLFLVFVLAVALLVGGTVGYLVKPASIVSGPTHYVVVPASQTTSGQPDCIQIGSRIAC